MGIWTSAALKGLAILSIILIFLFIAPVTAPILALTVPYFFRSLHYDKSKPRVADDQYAPVSVSYFPSRECSYACGFCFHTNTSGYILPLNEAKRGLRLLKGKNLSSPFAFPRPSCFELFHNAKLSDP